LLLIKARTFSKPHVASIYVTTNFWNVYRTYTVAYATPESI